MGQGKWAGRGPRNCGGEARESRTVIAKGVAFLGHSGEEGREMRGEGGLARPLSFVLASWWHRGVTKGVLQRVEVKPQQTGPEGQMLVCWGGVSSKLRSTPGVWGDGEDRRGQRENDVIGREFEA